MFSKIFLAKSYFNIPRILHFSYFFHTQSSTGPKVSLTKQAFATLLQSCSSNPNHLKQIHTLLLTSGLSIKNSLITHLLTNLIALGDMLYARQLFDEMHKPRTFLWNTLIRGYVKNDLPVEATSIYRQMHLLDICPDGFTFPFVIKACAELVQLWAGSAVHTHVLKHGLEFVAMIRTELIIISCKQNFECTIKV